MMGKIIIDDIDRRLLQYLIDNARMPFLEIARECGISGAAIHQRVKKLDDAGVILGSRLVVDPKSLGFGVCAIIGVMVSDSSMNLETVTRLREIPEITECHFITGKFNIMIKVYCRDNDHLMQTIFERVLSIPSISSTETFISLSEVFAREVDVRRAAE